MIKTIPLSRLRAISYRAYRLLGRSGIRYGGTNPGCPRLAPPAATFFARDPLAHQGAVHGRRAAGHAGGGGQLQQGGVIVGSDGLSQSLGGVPVEGGGAAAAVGRRLDGAGLSAPAHELADPGDADAEARGDLLAGIAGGDNALAQVDRLGFHLCDPSGITQR